MSIKDKIKNLGAVIGLTAVGGFTLGVAELAESARDGFNSSDKGNMEETTVLYEISDHFIPVKVADGSFDAKASESIIKSLNLKETLPYFQHFSNRVEFELTQKNPDRTKMYDAYNKLLDSVFGQNSSGKKVLLPYANSMIDFVKESRDNFESRAVGGYVGVVAGCAMLASALLSARKKRQVNDLTAALPPQVKAAMLAIGGAVLLPVGLGVMATAPFEQAANLGPAGIERAFVETQRGVYNDYHFNKDGSQKTHTDTPKIYRFVDNSR